MAKQLTHRQHYVTALALQRTAHADAQFPRLRHAVQNVTVAAVHDCVEEYQHHGRLKITPVLRKLWAARLDRAIRAPLRYMAVHGYSMAGRETGGKSGQSKNGNRLAHHKRANPTARNSAKHGAEKEIEKASEGGVEVRSGDDFVLNTDWRGLDKFVSTTAESASATLGKRMLSIFETAAAYRDPDTGRGKTPADIARDLMTLGGDMSKERAEMLARTGSIFAYNEGAMQRYADDGVEVMQWLTADDDLTCPYCAELNAKMVPPKESFYDAGDSLSIGGATLNFKYAVKHPPAHPRCRCTVIPIVDAAQLDDRHTGALPADPLPVAPPPPAPPPPPMEPHKQLLNELLTHNVAASTLQSNLENVQAKIQQTMALQAPGVAPSDEAVRLIDKLNEQQSEAIDRVIAHRKQRAAVIAKVLDVPVPANVTPVLNGVIKSDPARRAVADEGLRAFNRLCGTGTVDSKAFTINPTRKRRSFASNSQVYMSAGAPSSVVVHEMGHWLEASDPEVARKAQAFLRRRTANEAPVRLKSIYPRHGYKVNEITKRDKFVDAYTGKQYIQGGVMYATEIMSMGMQAMVENPEGFATADPDFFDFVYNTLRGK